MVIGEAIKELEMGLADKWCPWSKEIKASIRLGIEALKRIQVYRTAATGKFFTPLPGETEE